MLLKESVTSRELESSRCACLSHSCIAWPDALSF